MSDLYIKVKKCDDAGWQRPSEWLTLPQPGVREVVGLYLVFENEYNDIDWTNAGATPSDVYDVDLGDGTTVQSNNFNYVYDYNAISAPVYQYEEDGSMRNYKQVIVTFTPIGNATNLSLIRNNGINNDGSRNFADIHIGDFSTDDGVLSISTPKSRTGKTQEYLRILKVDATSSNNTFYENFGGLDLKIHSFPDNDLLQCSAYAFQETKFSQDLRDIQGFGQGVASTFRNCSFQHIRNITSISGNSLMLNTTFLSCNNVIATGEGMFNSARGAINGSITYNGAVIRNMFRDSLIKEIVFDSITPSNPGQALTMFIDTTIIHRLVMPGFQNPIRIQNNSLTADALLETATSLADLATLGLPTQEFRTTGNPGALDTAYITLATSKGWTVIN